MKKSVEKFFWFLGIRWVVDKKAPKHDDEEHYMFRGMLKFIMK